MNLHTVVIIAIAASFLKSLWMPGWYTCVEFVSTLAALSVLAKVVPLAPKNLKQIEIEEMKKVIEGLASEFKKVHNSVSNLRLALGLKGK